MTRPIELPAELKSRWRKEAFIRLQALLGGNREPASGGAWRDVEMIPNNLWFFPRASAAEIHFELANSPESFDAAWLEAMASRLSSVHEHYQLAATQKRTVSKNDRLQRLIDLAWFSAGVMIPVLARLGKTEDAIGLAHTHFVLITGHPYRTIVCCGSPRGKKINGEVFNGRQTRFLFLAPTLWSLAAHVL